MNLVYTNLFLANNLSKTLFSYLKQICSCSVVGKDEGWVSSSMFLWYLGTVLNDHVHIYLAFVLFVSVDNNLPESSFHSPAQSPNFFWGLK
jgi:hypothetical protein